MGRAGGLFISVGKKEHRYLRVGVDQQSRERKMRRVFPVDGSTMLPKGNGELGEALWVPVSWVPSAAFWLPGPV